MPTAAEFRRAATRFRALGEHLDRHAGLIDRWPTSAHLGRGPVLETVSDALAATSTLARLAGDDLRTLAGECERRAAVCDEYARRLREHWRLEPALRDLIPTPLPPFSWVD